MRFPNAYKGVSKLFYAEVLTLLVAILSIASAVLVKMDLEKVAVILGFVGLVFMIVAFILMMVGLHQSGKECDFHKKAFWLIVIAIVLGVLDSSLKDVNVIFYFSIEVVDAIIQLAINLLIVYGIVDLASKLREDSMAGMGKIIGLVTIVLTVVGIVLNGVGTFVKEPTGVLATILGASAIIAGVISLIVAIAMFFYVWQAKNMLERK